jgi:hypothetical protein
MLLLLVAVGLVETTLEAVLADTSLVGLFQQQLL